jgi:hypothetical protein
MLLLLLLLPCRARELGTQLLVRLLLLLLPRHMHT